MTPRLRLLLVAFALLAALMVIAMPARADFICLPKATWNPSGTGSTMKEVTTPAGEASGWWCLEPPNTSGTPPGKVTYAMHVQYALNKHRGHPDLRGAFQRVMAAPDLLAAVNGEFRAGSIKVVAGSQDQYEIRLLWHRACLALATPPYLVPIDPLPTNYCGAAPLPPAPPTVSWIVTPSGSALTRQAFAVVAGKRSISSDATAQVRAACDCSTLRLTEYGVSYCIVQTAALVPPRTAPHVAACMLQR